jgi:hypothetical protein
MALLLQGRPNPNELQVDANQIIVDSFALFYSSNNSSSNICSCRCCCSFDVLFRNCVFCLHFMHSWCVPFCFGF